jgi:hypothetical protein
VIAAPSDTAEEIVLGPFEAATGPEAVAVFVAATGASGDRPPATFPIVWLSLPELKQALNVAVGPGRVPVHESQSFDYERPLRPGEAVVLAGVARREHSPERLIVSVEAKGDDGRTALTMRSVLRVVELAGADLK